MQTLQSPQELKAAIQQLISRKEELESSRTIKEVVEENFSRRWSMIEQTKQHDFAHRLQQTRQVLRLEIALKQSIRDFVSPQFIEHLDMWLPKIRETNNLQQLTGVYQKFKDDIKTRQVIKLISATYRYNRLLMDGDKDPYFYVCRSNLKSQIKYATACPHCGEIAMQILNNMQRTKAVELPE